VEGLNGVVGTDGGSIRVSMTIRRTVSAAFGQMVEGMDLMPVSAAEPAVLFPGKRFHLYHAIGVALMAAGIVLASLRPRPA
jgi:drug/metabolite transporter (DMT)-like permease